MADPDPGDETTYHFELPESDVRALKNGIVTPNVLEKVTAMLAWQDDESNPFYRAYSRETTA